MTRKNFFVFFAILLVALLQGQGGSLYINRVFQDVASGPTYNPILNQFGVQWSNSINASGGGIITIGHTYISGQGENITLRKIDASGNLIFYVNYNASSSFNDYGIGLVEDGSGNIYAVGTTDNGGSFNYDLIVLKYSSTGTLISSTTYSGSSGLNDIGTAIAVHPISGEIIVAASCENTVSSYDYLILRLNPSSLSVLSSNTYDYANLIDTPVGLEFSGTGDISIIGASASSALNWDYAIAVFDGTTLSFITDTRNSISGVGYDQPLAFCKDISQNIYITGRASTDGINYDIRTIKILANFSIAWNVVYDGYGLEDVANTVDIDASGNVIVGGFITKSNNVKDLICIKYNGVNGSLLWKHVQPAFDQTGNAYIKKLGVDLTTGNVYFTAGVKGQSGFNEAIVGKIRANGKKHWERVINNVSADILPSDLKVANDGVYSISVSDPTSPSYLSTKYTEFETDSTKNYNSSGRPNYKKHELVVRFHPTAINTAAIDNLIGTKISEFGNLNDFLTATAYTQVITSMEGFCRECDIKAIKIFPDLPTTFTSTTSRLGQIVPVPDLWTALVLNFPPSVSIRQAHAALKTLPNLVIYSEPNYVVSSFTTPPPNDTLYYMQTSLHTTTNSAAHINVEEAWDIVPNCGSSYVKCGIFDTGIDYWHPEFYASGGSYSKIIGWDLVGNQNIFSNPIGDAGFHGTACSGIIGAMRNNNLGIAGIAGGSDVFPYGQGVQLYSLNILDSLYPPFSHAANAIFNSAITNGNVAYNYGLNVSNNSWGFYPDTLVGIDSTAFLIQEMVHFANRVHVTFVAARGNSGYDDPAFPATIDDDWVLCVGGTGNDGNYCNGVNCEVASSYGHSVDVAAPASYSTITTTWPGSNYIHIGQTSMAAPHVTGVVGLLMSYMNNPNNSTDPENLAPEDCEQIIQRSANGTLNGNTYNPQTGYGRLDAGKALRLVEKPYKALYHFGTSNSPYSLTKSVYSASDTITTTEPYKSLNLTWYNKGTYIVKTFEINATISHNLPYASDSLMYYWPRPSSSAVFELFDNNKRLRPRQRVTISSCNSNSANMKGYIYEVRNFSGNILGWWPCDTSFGCNGLGNLFEYSILVKNKAVGVPENSINEIKVKVFPNPANTSQTLIIETLPGKPLSIELFDLMGRKIKTIYNGNAINYETTIVNEISNLPNSLYIYMFSVDNKTSRFKFIKN